MAGGEVGAPLGDGVDQLGQVGDEPIDDRLVHQRPERLGGLQFGTVGRQVDQFDAVRHSEVGQGVPAGIVEQQHDALLGTGADRAGEGGEQVGEQRLGHGVGQVPDRLARGRAHEGRHIEPLEAVMAEGCRALSLRRPHRAQHRLQAEAVLVGAEHPDWDAGVGVRLLRDGVRQSF